MTLVTDSGQGRRLLVPMLMLAFAVTSSERFAVGMLSQDIKVALGLSDTQLGLISGPAFAVFYAVMGLPLARWADRGNRVRLISITLAIWSIAIAVTSAAASFLQMLLARVFVAIGEAGCLPAANSLIPDAFQRHERSKAMSVFMLGTPLGMGIGYFLVGGLNNLVGWRATLLVLAMPGFVLAALFAVLIVDRRTAPSPADVPRHSHDGVRIVLRSKPLLNIVLALIAMFFAGFGSAQWQPAFFLRTYGMDTAALGAILGMIYGASGFIGTWAGGVIASRWCPNDEPRQLKLSAAAFAAVSVLLMAAYLTRDQFACLGFIAVAGLIAAMTNGPLFAIVQTLSPATSRATVVAVILFAANVFGLSFGPLFAGLVSDYLTPMIGADGLRYALLAFCPIYIVIALHLFRAGVLLKQTGSDHD